ncbi:MAG TPA: flagellar biosynthetic protein FliQ [Terriglobales bacterium]|jgi:flagellar biosynthetic protein FliQ|nr:flagellar biosynthetic protein FliQ [Terriglobales bacterium]
MPIEQVIDLGRLTLREVAMIGGPVLAIAVVVSLLINIIQVLTSLQDSTISSVPRLLATAAGLFFLMPWMWRELSMFTVRLFSDLQPYAR